MSILRINVGRLVFSTRLEENAPRTCSTFIELLPFKGHIIQAIWSGEAAWIPINNVSFDMIPENSTKHLIAGQLLLYPGGVGEAGILFPYGDAAVLKSKEGQLVGNHFMTISNSYEQMHELGRLVQFEGAQDIFIDIN